jgi:regulator of chromosome condensation
MSVDETLSRLSLGSATARKRPQKRPTNSRKRNKPASKEPRILNTAPVTPLKVFVFGTGESGELGLGVHIINGKSPDLAPRPRHNHFLDAGVVQISVGGMHCAALMRDGTVFTWGVNDSKALGRNTTWQEPEEAGHGIVEMNPLESTPMAVKQLEDAGAIVQVAATDNATFVLTCTGEVYGWGSFFVSQTSKALHR